MPLLNPYLAAGGGALAGAIAGGMYGRSGSYDTTDYDPKTGQRVHVKRKVKGRPLQTAILGALVGGGAGYALSQLPGGTPAEVAAAEDAVESNPIPAAGNKRPAVWEGMPKGPGMSEVLKDPATGAMGVALGADLAAGRLEKRSIGKGLTQEAAAAKTAPRVLRGVGGAAFTGLSLHDELKDSTGGASGAEGVWDRTIGTAAPILGRQNANLIPGREARSLLEDRYGEIDTKASPGFAVAQSGLMQDIEESKKDFEDKLQKLKSMAPAAGKEKEYQERIKYFEKGSLQVQEAYRNAGAATTGDALAEAASQIQNAYAGDTFANTALGLAGGALGTAFTRVAPRMMLAPVAASQVGAMGINSGRAQLAVRDSDKAVDAGAQKEEAYRSELLGRLRSTDPKARAQAMRALQTLRGTERTTAELQQENEDNAGYKGLGNAAAGLRLADLQRKGQNADVMFPAVRQLATQKRDSSLRLQQIAEQYASGEIDPEIAQKSYAEEKARNSQLSTYYDAYSKSYQSLLQRERAEAEKQGTGFFSSVPGQPYAYKAGNFVK